jgi:hypothetical protein
VRPDEETTMSQKTAVENAPDPAASQDALVADRPAAGPEERPRPGHVRLSGRPLAGVLAALLLVSPVGAGVISSLQAPVYAAEADVLYVSSDVTDSQGTERELATQQLLLQSRPMIEAAAESSRRPAADLADSVSVDVLDQSNVLRLRVEDPDRQRAVEAAASLVDQYVDAVSEQAAASSTAAEERELLQAEVETLTTRLGEILAAPSGDPADQEAREKERMSIGQRLTELQEQILDAGLRAVQERSGRAQVFAAPSVLDEPVAPQPLRAAAGGALLGLLLATGLWTLLRHRHDRGRPAAR